MKELAKSIARFSWAISAFGMQQAAVILSDLVNDDSRGETSGAARKLSESANQLANNLDGPMKDAFRAGDDFQSGMIDLSFNAAAVINPVRMAREMTAKTTTARSSGDSRGPDNPNPGSTGWGPVPPAGF